MLVDIDLEGTKTPAMCETHIKPPVNFPVKVQGPIDLATGPDGGLGFTSAIAPSLSANRMYGDPHFPSRGSRLPFFDSVFFSVLYCLYFPL